MSLFFSRQIANKTAEERDGEKKALLMRMEKLSSQALELEAKVTEKAENESNALCRLESTQRALDSTKHQWVTYHSTPVFSVVSFPFIAVVPRSSPVALSSCCLSAALASTLTR